MLTGSHRLGPCIILYMTNTCEMSFKTTESGFRDRSHANFPSEGGVNLLQEGQFHIPLSANLPTAQGRSRNSASMRDGKHFSCQNVPCKQSAGSDACCPATLKYLITIDYPPD